MHQGPHGVNLALEKLESDLRPFSLGLALTVLLGTATSTTRP